MAKESKTAAEQGLTVSGEGVITDASSLAGFIKESGFSEERTMKVGDPSKGDAVLAYMGELIGPGPDIELNEALSKDREDNATIPTWLFHPIDHTKKELPAITAITHKVICPHQMDDICKGLQALKQAHPEKRVQASFMWEGKTENRLGQPLNKYRSIHRIVNKDGSVYKQGE